MKRLANPALHLLAAAGALVAFTWPLLVYGRAIQVFVAMFAIWLAAIALLFVLSRAEPASDAEPAAEAEDEEPADDHG
jgi:hypothetical protein